MIRLVRTAAAAVANALAGRVWLFVDDTGRLSLKDENGVVTRYLTDAEADAAYAEKVQNNLSASGAPTVNDDSDDGYSPRSLWFDTSVTPPEGYVCIDPSPGAAQWVKTSLTLDELGSAATANIGPGAGELSLNGDLGTAAFEDIGPAPNQVPTGQDLADGLEYSSGSMLRLVGHVLDTVAGDNYIALFEKGALTRLIGGTLVGGSSGGQSDRATLASFSASQDASGTLRGHIESASPFGAIELIEFDAGGKTWIGIRSDDEGQLQARGLHNALIYGVRNDALPLGEVTSYPTASVSNVTAFSGTRSIAAGRPGDSIGDNGAVRNPNQSLGEFTDVGSGRDEVPTGQDLQDGIEVDSDSDYLTAQKIDAIAGSNTHIALLDISKAHSIGGTLHRNNSGSQITSMLDFTAASDGAGDYNLYFQCQNRSTVVEPVQFDADGKTWIGLKVPGSVVGSTGFGFTQLKNATFTDPSLVSDITSFASGDVSNEVPLANEGGPFWSGRPGDSIGDNGALRNTNQSLGEATDFPVEEKGSWTPRIEGAITAGSHTYTTQDGKYWRYGKMYYCAYAIDIDTLDLSASGQLLLRGIPVNGDTDLSEHSAPIARLTNWTKPADLVVLNPAMVPQGGIQGIRFNYTTDGGTGLSSLDISSIGNGTQITGSFWYTVA